MNWDEFRKIFGDCELCKDKIIIKSKLREALKFVKSFYTYDILKEIVAVDRKDQGIELIYKLYSIEDEEELLLSIFVKNEIDSIVDIFPSAQADENEIYDMFGVNFIGNPNLKRLYMPDDWKGSPLKKDYENNDKRLEWNNEEYS